ncbi:MAG: dihydrodipicolinate synthase family protein [Mesorhizobium sp.]|uniref:dihydrodipicolinate synthase family protein n=1 Tax=Mesorhizobium sp. TaxID=1871066 RepID=UPI000FE85D26|nr:dihydrodipicolinate synthase family protein [Mesorhizobium sp.]RWB32146.1 MAG: dihydrodipicolinate synthase family protein [Mesorhizobium sp.]RWB81201.1 MAG: dihydrodipicolinate synthase family protein [Mesorhizobium sp.]RWF79291.1 MAG: dihydrodipicolinate synthase family protein [Mesorhizobium sp.]TIS68459.1 MAG: dihydrodipicolinate synthase family protein [Mesorhizobium sp.]TIW50484.1 MAG: dihydrodipicolinate synthase family protein [Mesorhizobium sp.]
MANLAGINLALQTPFSEDGTVDYKTWERLIDQYIEAGVQGLVLGSGTGQHPYLAEEECDELYRIGIRQIDGRCNAICQSSALNFDEVIRRSKKADALGANALMILPPYLEGPSDDDGLLEFYREIDGQVGVDIIGYNIPQATGISVSPDLYLRLNGLRNFNYIKDSAGDLTTHQRYLQGGGKVLNGCDTTTVYALMAGAVGAIWGGANFAPLESVALYGHVAEGRYAEALALWKRMLPAMLHIWTHDYVPCVVAAAHHRGFGTGNVRKPLRSIDQTGKDELLVALAPLLEGGK